MNENNYTETTEKLRALCDSYTATGKLKKAGKAAKIALAISDYYLVKLYGELPF